MALVGIAGAAGLVACAWFGIRLIMLAGPPLRRADWPPYLQLLGGIVVSAALILLSFRALERWGVRPPD